MFNIFKRFACCKIPSRACGWRIGKCAKCTREVLNINEITYEKLLEMVKGGAVLIDVRTKQEFLEKHLEGSVLIPYYEIASKIGQVVLDKNKTIIVYCQNGGRRQKAYETLKKLGYSDIYNLKGGIEGI